MPFVHITLVEGREPASIGAAMRGVAHAVADALSTPIETVRVVVTEVPATNWMSGAQTIAERRVASESST